MGIVIKEIKVLGGTYRLKVPSGRMGAIQFGIITKMAPSSLPEEGSTFKMSPADIERMGATFEEWAERVLPHILVEGPHTYEDMPGEDQYGLFMAMMEVTMPNTKEGDKQAEFFQVLN